jgi:hypothetical protein
VASSLDAAVQIDDPDLRRDAFDNAMERYTAERGIESWGTEARAWLEKADVPEEWKHPWRK